jgi:hypothetical protein
MFCPSPILAYSHRNSTLASRIAFRPEMGCSTNAISDTDSSIESRTPDRSVPPALAAPIRANMSCYSTKFSSSPVPGPLPEIHPLPRTQIPSRVSLGLSAPQSIVQTFPNPSPFRLDQAISLSQTYLRPASSPRLPRRAPPSPPPDSFSQSVSHSRPAPHRSPVCAFFPALRTEFSSQESTPPVPRFPFTSPDQFSLKIPVFPL